LVSTCSMAVTLGRPPADFLLRWLGRLKLDCAVLAISESSGADYAATAAHCCTMMYVRIWNSGSTHWRSACAGACQRVAAFGVLASTAASMRNQAQSSSTNAQARK